MGEIMPRLPQPGSDQGIWGEILNDFLGVAHNSDGGLKDITQSKVTGLTAALDAKADTSAIPTTPEQVGAEPAGLSEQTSAQLNSAFASQLGARLRFASERAHGRNSLDLGVMSSPPTITHGSATVDASLTKTYTVTANPSVFATSGGKPEVYATNFWIFPAVTLPNGVGGNIGNGNFNVNSWAVEFMADATKVEIRCLNGASLRGLMIEVDGQRVQASSIAWSSSTSTMYTLLTFGSRAIRHIRVECSEYSGFRAVAVGPTDAIWNPGGDRLTMAVVGDSITAMTGAARPNGGFADSLGKLLGIADVRKAAIGGTGMINPGTANSTFGDAYRVADVVACSPDIIVIPASPNDTTYTAGQITAAALATYQAHRAANPDSLIIAGGLFPGSAAAAAGTIKIESAAKAAFDAWADPNSFWIPIVSDPDGPWVYGTGRVGAATGNGNADLYVSSADTVHPSQDGHDYYARRWAMAIERNLLQ